MHHFRRKAYGSHRRIQVRQQGAYQPLPEGVRLVDTPLYPVSSNRVGYLMLLSLAVILTIVSNIGMSNDIFLALLIPLWGAYLTCVIATLLRPIRLHWAVWTVAVFLWLMEIFSVFFYSSLINVRLVKLILETDTRDS